ncbi:MAG: NAD(P)H-binding protein [Synechococcus sp.]|nr:NAD(P)H-binding protein [Synechococcus sp.]
MARTVLITTAHGMFGGALLQQLRGQAGLQVRAMVRSRRAGDPEEGNVSWVQANLDEPASLIPVVEGVQEVFLCTPMDGRIAAREMALVDALRAHSPDARVLLLYGAVDHQGDPLVAQHQQAIAHLQASGLRWTILSPNSVMETSLLPLAVSVPWGVVMGCSGHGRVGFVALEDVARVAAAVLTGPGPGRFDGQELVVTGPEALSMPEVCIRLSALTGRPMRFLDLPEESFQAMLLEEGSYGDPDRLETEVLCHLRAWRRGGAAIVTDTVASVCGRPALSVADWLEGQRALFAPARGLGQQLQDRLMGALLRLRYGRFTLAADA